MTGRAAFERTLEDWLARDVSAPGADRVLAAALDRVTMTRQERYVTQRLFGDALGRSARVRIGLAAALAVIALAGAVALAGALPPSPPPTPTVPSSNGLIVFAAVGQAGPGLERTDVDPRTQDRDLYALGDDGRPRRIVGTGSDGIAQSCPTFSPDGTRLAYRELDLSTVRESPAPVPEGQTFAPSGTDTHGAAWTIVITRLDPLGAGLGDAIQIRVPDAEESVISCPIWSPDGRRLAYTTDPAKDVWIASLDGATRRIPAPPNTVNDDALIAWSPDGRTIAYCYDDRLWFMPADGGAPTSITIGDTESVSWSPDGTRLLHFGGEAFHVTSRDGRELARIPVAASRQATGFWSPDGSEFALLLDRRIVVVSRDGSTRRDVLVDPGALNDDVISGIVTWSPDGTRLLVTTAHALDGDPYGNTGLASVPIDPQEHVTVLVRPTNALGGGTTWQGIRP